MTENIKGKKGIIFDCDGVLIESRKANQTFYNLILQALGLPVMSRQQEDYVHSHTVQESIRHIAPESRFQEALDAARRISYTSVLPHIELQPGLMQLLQTLRDKGILSGINTNRTNTMELILQRFALEDYFQPVVTSNLVSRPKPAPESLFKVLDSWGLDAKEVVFIGDSQVDAQAAQAANIDFWAYKNPQLEAEVHVFDFAYLSQVLRVEF
ncbi:MAG: HAD family hydrolase [Thermodesulfobacteriota bacterium]